MVGTVEEFREAIVHKLRSVYPWGCTAHGLKMSEYMGADGQPLVEYMGPQPNRDAAIVGLVAEGKITKVEADGDTVYHCPTDGRPPVVGHAAEIRYAILEHLYDIRPRELTMEGIYSQCFRDRYGQYKTGANGINIARGGEGDAIKRALDGLVRDGMVKVRRAERNGVTVDHYSYVSNGG